MNDYFFTRTDTVRKRLCGSEQPHQLKIEVR